MSNKPAKVPTDHCVDHLKVAVENATLMSIVVFLDGILVGWGVTRLVQGRLVMSVAIVLGLVGYGYSTWRYYATRGKLR